MTFTILVMVYNERQGLEATLPEVEKHLDAGTVSQIIVIDGGSKDGSLKYVEARGYVHAVRPAKFYSEVPKLFYIERQFGFRSAYNEAWPLISGDCVIYFSPDGNSPTEAIPRLVAEMEKGHDLVIASRYKDWAKSDDDDLMTAFGNRLFRTAVNLLFGGRTDRILTDPMVMLRAHRRDLPRRLGLDYPAPTVLERRLGTIACWMPLMSARALRHGCGKPLMSGRALRHACRSMGADRHACVFEPMTEDDLKPIHWAEIPANEPARIGGERKLKPWRWGLIYMTQFLLDRFWPKMIGRIA